MSQTEVVISNKYGFHVRPSTTFAKLAKEFSSKVSITIPGGPTVDGKNIMMLMTLGATCGTKIQISAEGEDAAAAVAALADMVNGRFGGID